jgi:hypothetical protein
VGAEDYDNEQEASTLAPPIPGQTAKGGGRKAKGKVVKCTLALYYTDFSIERGSNRLQGSSTMARTKERVHQSRITWKRQSRRGVVRERRPP